MGTIGGGNGGLWWNWTFHSKSRRPRFRSDASSDAAGQGRGFSLDFPLRPAATASALALVGDTIAQLRTRWNANPSVGEESSNSKNFYTTILENHDWLRAFRMASYGFLLYGPGSYAWYQFLDRSLPEQNLLNFSLKVLLNQIVLGPCVIAVVFAWNSLWQGKLSELPGKYQKDALPTLLFGFRFWIPVSILNFGVIPLQARVAFMSSCAIFWNYYLSTTMTK